MRILVTGGAGYIGSEMVRQLAQHKIDTTVVDSLENGHQEALPVGVPLRVGNIGDEEFLADVFRSGHFDAVIHFAAYLAVKESVLEPNKYFRNNVAYTNKLLDVMKEFGVQRLVFSSSCAIYGNPEHIPISEDEPKRPINPYGLSKLMMEEMMKWCEPAWGLHAISLRYFNASGATLDGQNGEDHPDEPHIIPVAMRSAMARKPFYIFGTDYPTPDGTCIRDYIHVIDLCQAHLLALDALMQGHASASYNVGTGHGYSNREVAEAVHEITRQDLDIQYGPRRPGDPARLVADPSRLKSEFGWEPHYSDLATVISTAWKWHQSHPLGYATRAKEPDENRR